MYMDAFSSLPFYIFDGCFVFNQKKIEFFMSSRALRRLNDNKADNNPSSDDDNDSEDDVKHTKTHLPLINPFDALTVEQSIDSTDDSDQDDQDKPPPLPSTNNKNKSKLKKKKQKKNNATVPEARPELEMPSDLAVEREDEQSDQDKGVQETTQHHTPLLEIKKRSELNEQAELKRRFGTMPNDRPMQVVGQLFLSPHPQWIASLSRSPVVSLRMRQLAYDDSEEVKWFSFDPSDAFLQVQYEYFNTVSRFDSDYIIHINQKYPRHPTPLVHLAWQNCQMGDYGTAGEYIVRALYLYESSFGSTFKLTDGATLKTSSDDTLFGSSCRMSFSNAANRPFFIALYIHIQLLCRRGAWQTAFAFTKCLLRLDPELDPMSAWLLVDFIACRAHMYQWVDDVYRRFKTIQDYPNWKYSAAMAQFHLAKASSKDFSEANVALQKAILDNPAVATLLLPSHTLTGLVAEPTYDDKTYLMCKLYVSRSMSVWQEPDVSEWLTQQMHSVTDKFQGYRVHVGVDFHIPSSVFRHLYLSDFVSSTVNGIGGGQAPGTELLQALMPTSWRSGPLSLTPWGNEMMQSFDPFPPTKLSPVDLHDSLMMTSAIFPYEGYFRGRLLQAFPHLIPLVLATHEHGVTESCVRGRLSYLKLEPPTITNDFHKALLSTPVSVNSASLSNPSLSLVSAFFGSMLPSWSGAQSNKAFDDMLDVPGLISFLQGSQQ